MCAASATSSMSAMCCTAACAVPGNTLRIAVELSESQTGNVIWADRFDGELTELFDLQDRIALRVATAIAPQLRERELDPRAAQASRQHDRL